MKYTIAHELPGRVRLRNVEYRFSEPEACAVKALIETQDCVLSASVSHLTGSILIFYETSGDTPRVRDSLLAAVAYMDRKFYADIDGSALMRPKPVTLTNTLLHFFTGVTFRAFLPSVLSQVVTFFRSLPLLIKGLEHGVKHGFATVSVLDAAAVGISLLRRDFKTVSIITSLIALSSILEEWTHKKSKESLVESLALNVDKVWVIEDGCEIQIPFRSLKSATSR